MKHIEGKSSYIAPETRADAVETAKNDNIHNYIKTSKLQNTTSHNTHYVKWISLKNDVCF